MNVNDLLSKDYADFADLLLNNKSDIDSGDIDIPSLFDIPVSEFLIGQLEGGKVMNRDAVINFIENQILIAAQTIAAHNS